MVVFLSALVRTMYIVQFVHKYLYPNVTTYITLKFTCQFAMWLHL